MRERESVCVCWHNTNASAHLHVRIERSLIMHVRICVYVENNCVCMMVGIPRDMLASAGPASMCVCTIIMNIFSRLSAQLL